MAFIRVRAAEGALHEFDVAEAELRAYPDIYEVVDPTPVDEARPARYVTVPEDPPKDSSPPKRSAPRRSKK